MIQDTGADNSLTPSNDFFSAESIEATEQAIKGENPHVFRVAQAELDETPTPSIRVDGPVTRTTEEIIGIEPAFSAFQNITGSPFTAAFYKMDKIYKQVDLDTQTHIKKVEEYIHNQIRSQRLLDTSKSAIQVIKNLEKKVGINDNNDPFYRLERISRYIDAIRKYNNHGTLKARLIKSLKNGSA